MRLFAILLITAAAVTSCAAEPPQRPELSADEQAQLVQEQIGFSLEELMAAHPDAIVPQTQVVRVVTEDEWAEVHAQCLTDAGFPTTAKDGGITTSIADGQEEAHAIALYICRASYPIEPEAALSNEDIAYLHTYFVETLIPCLEAEGYSIPDAPTAQRFIDEYHGANSWTPYTWVHPKGGHDQWAEINEACPQSPF